MNSFFAEVIWKIPRRRRHLCRARTAEVLLAVEAPRHPRTPIAAPPVRVSQRARELLNAPFTPRYANVLSGAFRPGVPALDVFPFDLWAKLLAKHARLFSPNDAAYQGTAEFRPLREAIADHVTVARSVRCTADQVMIVPGSQGGLDLALRVLLDVGDQAWMEDPYYFGAHGALRSAGAQIIPVPVDAEGLIVSEGIRRAPDARVVYVTPSHQMPLGMTMTLRRRLALLEWAQQADAYILEDDCDSEFLFRATTGRAAGAGRSRPRHLRWHVQQGAVSRRCSRLYHRAAAAG
ncbi:MAG: PLP-dependent aminotransferase family protein [Anaerolineae bacterium]